MKKDWCEMGVSLMETEIIEAVRTLNEEFYTITDMDDEHQPWSFTGNGSSNIVEYWGNCIWSEDYDCRKYDDTLDEYELLVYSLRREANKLSYLFNIKW